MKKLYFRGKNYEMKPHTMAITRKEDELRKVVSQEDAYIKLFDYAHAVFGEESVNDILGSNNIEEIDTKELELLCNEIGNAYDYEIIKHQSDYANKIASESKALDKIIETGKSASMLSKMSKR